MMPEDYGAHAERVAVSERLVVPKPASLSMIEAASLPVVAMTALRGLRKGTPTKRGDRVLVNGASGGVGLSAVQIAKAMGAHVTAVASAASFELVERMGADATVDYKTTDFRRGAARFDRVFDCVGSAPHATCKDVLQGPEIPRHHQAGSRHLRPLVRESALRREGLRPHHHGRRRRLGLPRLAHRKGRAPAGHRLGLSLHRRRRRAGLQQGGSGQRRIVLELG